MQTDIRKLAKTIAGKGRRGDKGLVHMTPKEIGNLKATGAVTTNPDTGLPEAFGLDDITGAISSVAHGVGNTLTGVGKSVLNPQQLIGSAAGLGVGGAGGLAGGQIGGNVISGKDFGAHVPGAITGDVIGLGIGSGIAGSGIANSAPAAPLSTQGASALGAGGEFPTDAAYLAADDAANLSGLEGGSPAASAAPAATTAPAAPGNFLSNNAIPLGVLGGVALLNSRPKPQPPDINAQRGLSAEAQGISKQLTDQYKAGTLSAPQQADLDQQTQNAKNQINSYFASIKQTDSTAHIQALAQLDKQALAAKRTMLDTALQQGLQAIGVATGPLNTAISYQLGQDKMLNDALSSFGTAVGTLYGRQAGKTA